MSISRNTWLNATGGLPSQNLLLKSAVPVDIAKYLPDKGADLVFYDCETPWVDFKNPRWKSVTLIDVLCSYSTSDRKYRYFTPTTLKQFKAIAENADAGVSFNGSRFDDELLTRKLGLTKRQSLFKASVDLFTILRKATGQSHSLNNLAYVNLGEKKKVFGKDVPNLPFAGKKAACKSDVHQLRRLYALAQKGVLKAPAISITGKDYKKMPFGGICPLCHDIACVNEIPATADQYTEGQLDDFDAGFGPRGFRCFTCGEVFIFENGDLCGSGPDAKSAVICAMKRER